MFEPLAPSPSTVIIQGLRMQVALRIVGSRVATSEVLRDVKRGTGEED